MSNAYYALILQFSCCNVKLGFAGDAAPIVDICPDSAIWRRFTSLVDYGRQYPEFLSTESHSLDSGLRKKVIDAVELQPELKSMVDQYNSDMELKRWTDWEQRGFLELARLIKHCISLELLVSPSRCKFFVIDHEYLGVTKLQLGQCILGQQSGVAISFLPVAPLVAISAFVEDAVVVHLGWKECSVSVVSDLRVILKMADTQCTLESLHYQFVAEEENFSFEEVESAIRQQNEKTSSFTQNILLLVSQAILKLDIDTRPKAARHVVIVGCENFKSAILSEIQKKLPTLSVGAKDCLGPWAGASVYCSSTLLRHPRAEWKHMEISSEKLETEGWREFQAQLL